MSVMIDWITVMAPLASTPENDRAFNVGFVGSFTPTPDGELVTDWATPKRCEVEGSYSSKIIVKRATGGGFEGSALLHGQPAIYISGNPAKWFQGHNVFGSGDLHGLAVEMLLRVCALHGATPSAADLDAWHAGRFDVHRADCTASLLMANEAQAMAALHALDSSGHMRFRGRGKFYGTSIVFGAKSRRSSLMFYAKAKELMVKGHRLPDELAQTSILAHAKRLLRSEARCFTPMLKAHGLHLAMNWADNSAADLHRHHLEALEIAESTMIEASTLEGLSGRLQLAYSAWKQGQDLRATLPRRTFYRYRNELLRHGIDIAVKQEARHIEQRSTPLRLVITASPAPVPDWAVGTPLYFEPRARAA
jgi:II/X family phage/plasmid replication protein